LSSAQQRNGDGTKMCDLFQIQGPTQRWDKCEAPPLLKQLHMVESGAQQRPKQHPWTHPKRNILRVLEMETILSFPPHRQFQLAAAIADCQSASTTSTKLQWNLHSAGCTFARNAGASSINVTSEGGIEMQVTHFAFRSENRAKEAGGPKFN
jgi:hypothetical protein